MLQEATGVSRTNNRLLTYRACCLIGPAVARGYYVPGLNLGWWWVPVGIVVLAFWIFVYRWILGLQPLVP